MVYPYNGHPSWTNLGVRNLPRVFTPQCAVETRTHNLSIASPTLYRNTTTPPSLLSSATHVWLQVLLLLRQFSQNLCSPSTCPKAQHLYWSVTWVVLRCQRSAGSRTESNLEMTRYVQRWVIWQASPLHGLVVCGLNTPASTCAEQQMSLASQSHLLPSVSSVSDCLL